ncbi:glycosyltransferase family 2 protein [Campylobacter gastrosuis]|uniref:Glycosyltransferase family 2 protein n=1 Tax=Campylobacter gastrosuis TaxID=2974576 RepID=A0ABT7HPN8_9BACT|nr:glycosyltransferase family 2 protein [Campylobacter gastrosuis]MDL0088866.1 glycosyltransferase family 2 protein [Campylobacter gastrosuis]
MSKFSVVILTFNSQKYLREVLNSVEFADEVVVVDSGSSDETLGICSEFKNVRVLSQKWLGFGAQKQYGVDSAKFDWVFVLDSDEIFTNELRDELKNVLNESKFRAYKVARLNYFFGKSIKSMGLYPDFSVRFFNKKYASFDGREIHEKVVLNDKNEKFGEFKNHFIHYAYDSVYQFIDKQNRYSTLGAKRNIFKAIFNPFWTFFRLFILKGGFKDGFDGYVIAKLYAQYTFWKYIK